MSVMTMKTTRPLRPLLIAALVVAVLGAGLWLSGFRPGVGAQLVREPISQPLGEATSAEVTIAMAVGQLRVGALEQPGALIDGEIAYLARNRVVRDFALRGDTASFSLREEDSEANSLVRYDEELALWDLRLAPVTPMRLTIEAGLGESTIDLAGLMVRDLTLKSGIGNNMLTLPAQGQVRANVEGGLGNTTIRIPAGVAVRLNMTVGFGTIHSRQGDAVAVSPGYEAAANRVELTVSSGIGNITIQQIGE
jgi:Cell wall-active antibiotics response 4TMS YvqF